MKKILRVFDVVAKCIAFMSILIGVSVVLIAVVPRRVEKATLNVVPRIAEFFNVDSAELVSSPNGDTRFIIELEEIDKEYLVSRCIVLLDNSPYERMAFLFYNDEKSLSIIVNSEGKAFAEEGTRY